MKLFKFTVVFILFQFALMWGQFPGSIVGIISDDAGNPLIGVNVYLENTDLGASTDLTGFYVISNVVPKNYRMICQYVGYAKLIVEKIQVVSDEKTIINVTMREETMTMDEVVVVAERPLVKKDVTSKVSSIDADEIQALPVSNIVGLMATQSNISILTDTPYAKAGYNLQGVLDFRMRGGRNNEVGLYIDGVKVTNPVFGGFGTNISNNAIQQLSIVSGGFSAKYGNALSGMINLTTKEGDQGVNGSFRYLTSVPFGISGISGEQSLALNRQNLQFTVSVGKGPLSFFLSGETNTRSGSVVNYDNITWNDYLRLELEDTTIVLPTSKEIKDGYLEYGNLESVQPGLAQNWRKVKGPDGRLINPLDEFKGWHAYGWDNSYNLFGKIVYRLTPSAKFTLSYLKDQRYRQITNNNAYYYYNMSGQNIQILSSNKLTLSFNHVINKSTFYNFHISRFFSSRKIRILRDYNNKFAGNFNLYEPDWNNIKGPEEYVPYASNSAILDPFESRFYMLADNRWYSGDQSINTEARIDFTHQFGKTHQIDLGGQYNRLDLQEESYQNISRVDPFPTIYSRIPEEGAIYGQLKLDFDKFILNFGLRMDYYNSKGNFWADPFSPVTTTPGSDSLIIAPYTDAEPNIRVSPRVGLAYPLNEASILFFNFGHFYQAANYRDLFRASGENREASLTQGNLLGNPLLEPEKSVQYEVGWQQQLGEIFGLKISLWAKETTHQVGSIRVPAYSDENHLNPFTYSVFINDNFGSGYGVDFSFEKKLSNNFSGVINYSYMTAKVLQATSWDGFWSGSTVDSKPKRESRAPWDKTHSIRINLNYVIPADYTFGDWLFNAIYYGESGFPYTPIVDGGGVVEPYSEEWPIIHRVDLRISKFFNLSGNRFQLFIEIKNLLDTENIITGYYRTGSATNPGTSTFYTRSSSYWDSRIKNNFALRRLIYWGLEISM